MIDHLCKPDVIGDTIVVSLDCLQLQAGTSWQVDAGHLTCGNSTTATISPSTAKINLGFSPNKNMTNSSWKLSLVSQKLQRND
jgi:hypothetical protein